MLLILAVVLMFSAGGTLIVAKVAHWTMARLGLEFWSVLCWFGIAEAPRDELAARRGAAPAPRRTGLAAG